jgi:ribosomal protein S18 acetylase RimI-like enzyme
MSTDFSLAPITMEERQAFLTMAAQHFRELNPAFIPAQDWRDSYFEKIQANPAMRLCWLLAGGQAVGFIIFGVEEHRFLPRKSGAIYELYVVPQQRKRGIARGCAEKVICELQRLSVSKIQLEVVEGNAAALKLWKSLGFHKVTERLVLVNADSVAQ